MSRFHTVERLGTVQSTTREGFLVCEGVPISRVGTMPYADGELPRLKAGRDGILWVTRDEMALFDAAAVASFEGKSVVDMHPYEDVTAENWRKYAVGHVQHVRRGEGDQAHLLIADLVIKDAAAIRAVRSGKRHVSCGYDADYEQTEPGRARQTRIVGNHVALVAEGRCGPTCSIGDAAMNFKTMIERLRSAHANKDDQLFASTLSEMDAGATGATGTAPVAVHVHTGDSGAKPAAPAAPAAAATEQQQTGDAFQTKTLDALNKLTEGMTTLATKFEGLEGKVTALEGKAATGTAAATGDAAAPAGGQTATKDSAALKDAFADVVARAECLIPGVKVPTFDSALPSDKTEEVLCGFRRQVLSAALTSGTGRQHVEPVLGRNDVTTMTCDGVAMVFQGATELARIANNKGGSAAGNPGGGAARTAPPTPTEINEANRKFWARQNAA